MSDKHSKFEAHDVSPPKFSGNTGQKKYTGPERRRENRRVINDRRTEVRFEPGKEDRRQKSGRREDDHTPKFW